MIPPRQAFKQFADGPLQADYIIILGLTKGSWGFPSTITDDPVLELAIPANETFPFAEERRLFYVALTRTKRAVLMLTVRGKESPFLVELIRDHHIPLRNAQGKDLPTLVCPAAVTDSWSNAPGATGPTSAVALTRAAATL